MLKDFLNCFKVFFYKVTDYLNCSLFTMFIHSLYLQYCSVFIYLLTSPVLWESRVCQWYGSTMEKSDCLKCMKNGAFQSSLATAIEKERVKHIQFTNVDTDSDVESTEVSIPSLEQLRQIRVDRFKTPFSNNSDALLPTRSPSYSSSTISSSSSSLNVNINPPNTPSTVAGQDIASYSVSTKSMNGILISTVESPRVRLRPLRFRHSIRSPSLAMNSNSFKPVERDTNTEQNISIL